MRLTGKVPPPSQVVETVLSILRNSQNGATTREIYERATPRAMPRNNLESASEHPFQSMRYLKKTVLATMQQKRIVEKFHLLKVTSGEDEAEAAKPPSSLKSKKKASNGPKIAWYWRIHEWNQSVEQAKVQHEKRVKRKETKHHERASASAKTST